MEEKVGQQREIYYSGRVQGVGFRYTVRALAANFQVSGTVRNLPDGRVHLIVEGRDSEIKAFVDAIESEMGGYIHGTQETIRQTTGKFKGFEIKF